MALPTTARTMIGGGGGDLIRLAPGFLVLFFGFFPNDEKNEGDGGRWRRGRSGFS